MFDFRRGQWYKQAGVEAELVSVPPAHIGHVLHLKSTDPALVIHSGSVAPTFLASGGAEVKLAAGDALLLFSSGGFSWSFDQVVAGASSTISFRATLMVANPVLLATWLRQTGETALGIQSLHSALGSISAQAALERIAAAPRGNLSSAVRVALHEVLPALCGLHVERVANAQIHERRIALDALAPGVVVERRWRLVRELGSGAFGDVWLAEHTEVEGLRRALKFVRDVTTARWVRREADRLIRIEQAGIDYRHVARLIDLWLGDVPCLAYEYVAGRSLGAYLEDHGGTLPPDEAAALVAQVLAGLAEIHRAGLIHRDLHPGNIMVVSGGAEPLAKILDFGLAMPRVLPGQPVIMASGLSVEPTHPFAEPLQQRGDNPPYERTDLYSVGALFWWLLTGQVRVPDSWPLLLRIVEPAFASIIYLACKEPREERFSNAAQMLASLSESMAGLHPASVSQSRQVEPEVGDNGSGYRSVGGSDGEFDIPPADQPLNDSAEFFEQWDYPQADDELDDVDLSSLTLIDDLEEEPSGEAGLPVAFNELADALRRRRKRTFRSDREQHVALDGLTDAVERAPDGAIIRLQAGTYELAEPLLINRTLILIGAGSALTTIRCTGGDYVLLVWGQRFTASDLTFAYEGDGPSNVVEASAGEGHVSQVDFRRCHSSGAKVEAVNHHFGIGLALGRVEGRVEDCHASANGCTGILAQSPRTLTISKSTCKANVCYGIWILGGAVRLVNNICEQNGRDGLMIGGDAAPVVQHNVCTGKGQDGIAYRNDAAGTTEANQCLGNARHGIGIQGAAHPAVRSNTCNGNRNTGIAYSQQSHGMCQGNECRENEGQGILVDGDAVPDLVENTCRDNKCPGIVYVSNGASAIRGNTASGNNMNGILVAQSAAPLLEGNVSEGNVENGIAYLWKVGGIARGNRCSRNGASGIDMSGSQARVVIESNHCVENTYHGIDLGHLSRGVAKDNTCTGNKTCGILVTDEANFTLEDNICEKNLFGIAFSRQATGSAIRNRCHENEWHGISVSGDARVVVETCQCSRNNKVGIGFWDAAGGKVSDSSFDTNKVEGVYLASTSTASIVGCTCSGNTGEGILCEGIGAVDVRDNRCYANGCGLLFCGAASGRAWHNTLDGNRYHGLYVGGEAKPELFGNLCLANQQSGIFLCDDAGGKASENAVTENGFDGIAVRHRATPILDGNRCEGNQYNGINYIEEAGGAARGNICSNNQRHGIRVAATASPTLSENDCRGNAGRNLLDERSADRNH